MQSVAFRPVVFAALAAVFVAAVSPRAGDAADRKTTRTGRIDLKLTADQREAMKDIRSEYRNRIVPLVKERKRLIEELKRLRDSGADERALKSVLSAMQRNSEAMKKVGDAHREALMAVLTPEQQAALALWKEQKRQERRNNRRE